VQLESFYWKGNQPITEDYIHRFDKVKELFEYDPRQADVWKERAAWLDEGGAPRVDRNGLADALLMYNRRFTNHPAVLQGIQSLRDHQALAVVGGQQAGLFTGPLLVIYKATTLIQAARKASEALQRPVVPVFWIAGEDHDFEEVNHVYALSGQLELDKIKIVSESGGRTSISRLPIHASQWEAALNELDGSLMDTEFKPEWMNKLRDIAAASSTLVDFFAHVMSLLFGDYGLVLLDSDDPRLRRLETELFERLITDNRSINDALLETQAKVRGLGYPIQAEVHDDAANLFIFEQGERLLLHRDGDRFVTKRRGLAFTAQHLLDRLSSEPENFSNNVMTRPLMQDYLFPVLGTVLGPGEIAYWALTRQAFRQIGMKMPIVIPRLEVTLLEGTVQKHMRKYGLSLDDVIYRFEERQKAWLDAQDTLHLEDKFEDVKQLFRQSYEPLIELVSGINPGLKKLGETNLAKILEQIDFLRNKAADAQKSQFDSALRQLERIRLTILPLGKPQERVYNVFAYLNRYGNGWLRGLIEHPLEIDGMHKVYYF
jgi:bacillithiol biosynthesis cysteine-adding enzyme BshC